LYFRLLPSLHGLREFVEEKNSATAESRRNEIAETRPDARGR
jgi:hypothetical protein